MTMNPKQKEIESKKELDQDPNYKKTLPDISSSSSRKWSSSFKNPRIVRVSRAFGGKDRHSKVCTVRGLRDRRIRLSVPTAIQLYDLQDRLGLNQPSKVVDWLIDVTKNEIDKLPPLPMFPSNLTQMFHPSSQDLGIPKRNNHEQENQEGFGGFLGLLSSQNLFPINNQTSFPNLAYNNPNFFPWDPSNLSLSQFGVGFSENHQPSDNLSMPFPYNLCPSSTNIPSFITPSMDNDLRQVNQNPLLPTTLHLMSTPMKSFMNPKNVHVSQENDSQKKDKFLKIQR